MSKANVHQLHSACSEVRELVLNLHWQAKSGHIGSSLSCCELLTFLRFHCHATGDEIVLSKGHAASALYATLAIAGDINRDDLISQYYKDGTIFSAHPPGRKLKGILFATGSLGHGPGLATGLALASRLANSKSSVYCLMSDGELNEGSVWEAFMFAAHNRLNNLLFVVDRNRLQGFGRTNEVLDTEPLKDKFLSFGLEAVECEGHSFQSLLEAQDNITKLMTKNGRAGVIIAHTIKGHGLSRLADTVDCHYLPMTDDDYHDAMAILKNNPPTNTR